MRRSLFNILITSIFSGTLCLSDLAIAYPKSMAALQIGDEDQPVYHQKYSYDDSTPRKIRKKVKRHGGGFPQQREATGRRVFVFNPNILTWAVYNENGNLVRTGHGVGGKGYCPDSHRRCKTPSGVFHVLGKAGPGFKSSKYPLPGGGAPMPYAMFFSRYYAIHGSNDVPNYNASHGCIRVYTSDARWLNQNFLQYGSTVIVHPY